MKKINFLMLSFTVAGSILGAGYVSGQELWQFFGSFGKTGFVGVVLAPVLFCLLSGVLICLSRKTGVTEMDKLIIPVNSPVAKSIFSFFEIFFLFGVCVIMTAGAGALFQQVCGFSSLWSSLIFTAVSVAVAVMGVNGMVTAFTVTVPLMVLMSVVMFFLFFSKNGMEAMCFDISTNSDNPLLFNWFVSALVYVSFNFFASLGMLAPLGEKIKNKKSLFAGLICGAMLLILIALCILYTLSVNPDAVLQELPMLSAASDYGKGFFYVFAFLLLCGMFGTSLGSIFAVSDFVKNKLHVNKTKSILIDAGFGVLIFAGSLIGFQKLIGIVYPIFGYLGFIAIGAMLIHAEKMRVMQKKNSNRE